MAVLLTHLTDDLAIWRSLTVRFRADIFCGLFLNEMNEGLDLQPSTLLAMGVRNLALGLDIYGLAPRSRPEDATD